MKYDFYKEFMFKIRLSGKETRVRFFIERDTWENPFSLLHIEIWRKVVETYPILIGVERVMLGIGVWSYKYSEENNCPEWEVEIPF